MRGMRIRKLCDLLNQMGHLTSSLICGLAPVLVTELRTYILSGYGRVSLFAHPGIRISFLLLLQPSGERTAIFTVHTYN